jgi:hypothetical protein
MYPLLESMRSIEGEFPACAPDFGPRLPLPTLDFLLSLIPKIGQCVGITMSSGVISNSMLRFFALYVALLVILFSGCV